MENENVPINYIFVDVPGFANQVLIYHLLNKSEAFHIRCLMSLPVLPADTFDLDVKRLQFNAALHRIMTPQIILRASEENKPDGVLWSHLLSSPLIVLMIIGNIPEWAKELSDLKPIGILTPYEETVQEARESGNCCVGLLKGLSDFKETYRVISEIIELSVKGKSIDVTERKILEQLTKQELFKNRTRLSFIPSMHLPSPDQGRPAAYLINRLSNNADAPSLIDPSENISDKDGYIILPRLLDYSVAACSLFYTIENGLEMPKGFNMDMSEVKDHYDFIMSNSSEEEKLKRWLGVGAKITGDSALRSSMMIAVPAARTDLLKDVLPGTLKKEPGHGKLVHMKRQALADHIKQKNTEKFKNKDEQSVYESSKKTLVLGHRLMATQAASLGLSTASIPLQTQELGHSLYNFVDNLNMAINRKSKKISGLFQKLEIKLADSLPEGILTHLTNGSSTVIFYSDLPFEWTLLDEWPICLTRPVSRIPIAGTKAWQVLAQTSRMGTKIDINSPEKVLVLDFISKRDKIRHFSDTFRDIADSLGQKYTYAKPSNSREMADIFKAVTPDVVVLDTHGNYKEMFDELILDMKNRTVKVEDFLPDIQVPPVWILSACDMAVVKSIKGSLIGPLMERGAVCVIATLQKIDAFVASIFVGKLLTEIYSQTIINHETLSDAFFAAQLTTALLYDPLFPLFRKAKPGTEMSMSLAATVLEYSKRMSKPLDIKDFRNDAAIVLHECLVKHGLVDEQLKAVQAGKVIPETLLFTAFGLPSRVELVRKTH